MQQQSDPSSATSEAPIERPETRFGSGPPSHAEDRKDWPTLIAIAAVGVGWFFLDAIELRIGHFISAARFYDLAAVMYRPSRLLTGSRATDLYLTVPFILVCLTAIAAPLAPRFTRHRAAWFGLLAPIALMSISCIALYQATSRDLIVVPPNADPIAQSLADLAHAITRKAGGAMSQHLSAGAGLWVSGMGAAYLAVIGWRRLRDPDPALAATDAASRRH